MTCQPDSRSCCLSPAGVTQPPLADYVFFLMNHLFIHLFTDHLLGARQCSTKLLVLKISDFFFFFFFLGPHPRHVEFPRLGIEPTPQQ